MIKVFVSATTTDFQACREAIKNVLLQSGLHPVTQEGLSADHRNLPDYLDALVQSCDCVVCLVGKVFGAAPSDAPDRSYTMREYDCAKRLRKPAFVYLATEEFYSGESFAQSEDETTWQRAHCDALLNEKYCRTFRSQTELEKEVAVSTSSICNASGRMPIHFCHLPPRPPYFAGRADEIAQLRSSMASRSPGVIAVIGMAGQGKTTLVHHVVEASQDDVTFSFQSGFWCTAGLGRFTFDMFLDEALTRLTPGTFDKTQTPKIEQRIQRLLDEMQQRRILIVIDALERWLRGWESIDIDPEELVDDDRLAVTEGLDDFVSQATALRNGSHLILISRAIPVVLEDVDKTVIPVCNATDYDVGLQGLGTADAVSMLKSFGIEATEEQFTRITAQLGCHPLALRVFGGYVKKRYGGVLARVANLQAWKREKTLANLFDDVYERLPGRKSSRNFLAAACCAIEDAPLEAIAAAQGFTDDQTIDVETRDVALMLADWQVITFDARSDVVGMHALLKEYFGNKLTEPERLVFHEEFSSWYSERRITSDPKSLADVKMRLLALDHAILAKNLGRCEQIVWGQVAPLYSLVEWFGAFGHFVYGVELLGRFAAVADDRLRARVLIVRAPMLRPIGHHNAAIESLDEAIAIIEQRENAETSSDVFDLAGALSNRGTFHFELTQYSQSVADFDRAVDLLLPLRDSEKAALQTAAAKANRAMVHRETGALGQAISDCTAAIETHQRLFDTLYQQLNADLASAYSNRGNAYRDLRCFDEALLDYEKACEIHSNLVNIGQSQFRGPQALCWVMHGAVLTDCNQHEEAIRELDDAVAAFQELTRAGKKHFEPMLAIAHMTRALARSAVDRPTEGVIDSQTAYQIYGRLVQAGRSEMRGPHAHSMLVRSALQYQSGDMEDSRNSWHEAVEQTTHLINSGEKDLCQALLRYSIQRAIQTVDSDCEDAKQIVQRALDVTEPIILEESPSEGLDAELKHAICRLKQDERCVDLSLDWTRIHQLEQGIRVRQ